MVSSAPVSQTSSGSNVFCKVIGIDLGRAYSRVGVFRNNSFAIISDEQGRTAIPNYVTFLGHGPPLVGFEAKDQALSNPKNTIYDSR
jgi:molecular chaperone DnaK (HSP70)